MNLNSLLPGRMNRTPSARERVLGFVLLALLAAGLAAYFLAGSRKVPGAAAPSAPERTAEVLPALSPGGFPRGAIERYDPDGLFAKIDGKADAYIAYDVVGLEFASYSDPARPDEFVDVYLYDMGEPLHALGIYRAERTGREEPAPLGEEACAPGGAVFVRKGRHYLQVLPGSDAVATEAMAIARAAAEALPPGDPPARAPDWFPSDGRTIVRYDLRNCLMVSSLSDAFLAVYADGAKALVARTGSPDAAAAAAAEAEETLEFLGTPAVFRIVGDRGVGVVGAPDEQRADALMTEVVRRIGGER